MPDVLPSDFDFKVLDDPSFKEDAVREEIVAPILRQLGYRPSGKIRVERSKALVHPFVMIGTTKHKVSIIPDYTLFSGDRALMVLDAKRPSEEITRSRHVEQAYSYAIHPEVRCDHYGLCNGKKLVVFEVAAFDPLLAVETTELNSRWDDVVKVLHHSFLEKPILRRFRPDFGLHARKAGLDLAGTCLVGFHIDLLAKQTESKFSATCGCRFGDDDFMVTFDLGPEHLAPIMESLPPDKRREVLHALQCSPFLALVGGKIVIDVGATFGPVTQGEHEPFVPLDVSVIAKAQYQPDFSYPDPQNDVPAYVYRL